MRLRPLLLSLSSLVLLAVAAPAAQPPKTSFEVHALKDLPDGLHDYQLGLQGGTLIVAGGLDASGKPLDTVYTADVAGSEWKLAGHLPQPRSKGAGASEGNGLVLLGGEISGQPTASVDRVTLDASGIAVTHLAELPQPDLTPGAAVSTGTLYVATAKGGEPYVASLSLAEPQKGWKTIAPYPGQVREGPSLAFAFDSLCVIGGTVGGQPVTEGAAWNAHSGWRPITAAPEWTPASAAVPLGESHVLLFVGAGAGKEGKPEILAYHSLTDTWIEFAKWDDLVPAAPHAVVHGDTVTVLSGSTAKSIRIIPPGNNYGWLDHSMVIIYLLGMVGMGAWFVRREKSTTEYFRAGKSAPWWAIGMSLFATAASAISLMTMPAKAYATDWTFFTITIFSVLCLPLSMYLLAPLVRKLNISTANEYLEMRFGVVARIVGSVIFMINQILARSAPVIFLPAIAMAAITGVNIWVWILAIGVVTTLYTFLGGLSAVIWTDTIQGIIMLGTVLGCLILILFRLDMTLPEMWSTLSHYHKFHTLTWNNDITYPTVWVVLIGTIFITLLSVGDQNFVQRVQAAPSLKDAKKAVATQMAVAAPINIVLFGLGTALFLYYRSHPAQLNPLMKTDGVYPFFAAQQLPPGVSGLVIAALLAASMSTISGAICSVANLGVDDFYRRFNPRASDLSALRLGRILSVVVGLVSIAGALYLSVSDSKSVWDWALAISGLVTNGTVGLFGLGLLTKRANEAGALTGVVIGSIAAWYLQHHTPVNFLLYAVVGSTITFISGYFISLVFNAVSPPNKPLEGLTVYTLREPRAQ